MWSRKTTQLERQTMVHQKIVNDGKAIIKLNTHVSGLCPGERSDVHTPGSKFRPVTTSGQVFSNRNEFSDTRRRLVVSHLKIRPNYSPGLFTPVVCLVIWCLSKVRRTKLSSPSITYYTYIFTMVALTNANK